LSYSTDVTAFRSTLAVLASVALASACGGAPEMIGVTPFSTPPKEAPAAASASSSAKPWPLFQAAKSWPTANAKRFVSAGHLFGRYEADVRVEPTVKDAYLSIAPGAKLPVGAKIAMFMVGADGSPGQTFAMEKEATGWAYVETDARGMQLRRGRLSPCVECHVHVADQDELFGVPVSGR
jgi:hypothetical protein